MTETMTEPDLFTTAGMVIPENLRSRMKDINNVMGKSPVDYEVVDAMVDDLRDIADRLETAREGDV